MIFLRSQQMAGNVSSENEKTTWGGGFSKVQ